MRSDMQKNRGILNEQLNQINEWDNADGDFDVDDAFGDDVDSMEAAGDNNQYTSTKIKKPVSMPYVYTVTSTDTQTVSVNMFGAERYNISNNFGNPVSISFSYDLSGYGTGVTGYAALLQRTFGQTFSVGRIRLECPGNTLQLSAPLNITDADPTGKSTTYPAVNFKKLNQYDQTAVETECDITIYSGTSLSYNHLAGGNQGLTIRWYFWAADVASLTRALEGKPAFKELRRPDTYLNQTIKFAGGQRMLK